MVVKDGSTWRRVATASHQCRERRLIRWRWRRTVFDLIESRSEDILGWVAYCFEPGGQREKPTEFVPLRRFGSRVAAVHPEGGGT
jgi:hypothetical protein